MTRVLSLVTALLIILGATSSCSRSESADASDLLATVPADASVVAVANVNAILDKAGCKVDGDKITPSDEISSLLATFEQPDERALAESFFNGNSGVDPSVILLFAEGYYKYLTGVASDPDKFKETVAKHSKQQFSQTDGIDICRNVALEGNRFWVKLDSDNIDPQEVKHFSTLSDEQSFLSKKAADTLVKFESDIMGWANINGSLNTASIPFQQRAMAQVAMQTIFDDATDATFSLSFNKGEMTGSVGVLNSKGEPAKFLLATETIDLKTIESIGGNTDMLYAMSIPHKLIEQLQKDTESKSASMLGIYLQALSAIDGTAALAANYETGALKGVVTTNGQSASQLTSMLDDLGVTVRLDGKMLQLSRGELNGNTTVAELAKEFKGSVAGIASTNLSPRTGIPAADMLNSFAVTLRPASSSIELRFSAKSKQPDQNFLLTLLRSANKK